MCFLFFLGFNVSSLWLLGRDLFQRMQEATSSPGKAGQAGVVSTAPPEASSQGLMTHTSLFTLSLTNSLNRYSWLNTTLPAYPGGSQTRHTVFLYEASGPVVKMTWTKISVITNYEVCSRGECWDVRVGKDQKWQELPKQRIKSYPGAQQGDGWSPKHMCMCLCVYTRTCVCVCVLCVCCTHMLNVCCAWHVCVLYVHLYWACVWYVAVSVYTLGRNVPSKNLHAVSQAGPWSGCE